MTTKPKKTIEEYISSFPEPTQEALQALRQSIRQAVPERATETVRYNMGTFQLDGKDLVYFAGWKKHVSLYPITDEMREAIGELAQHQTSGVTIRFPLGTPLPTSLITEIIKHRLEDMRRDMGS